MKIPKEKFLREIEIFLKERKKVSIFAQGKSMEPFMRTGDRIVLGPAGEGKVKKGSIVLAETEEGYVLHRIVRMRKGQIWLAGDANLVKREKIKKEKIRGVVYSISRNGKNVDMKSWRRSVFLYKRNLLRPWRIIAVEITGLLKKHK